MSCDARGSAKVCQKRTSIEVQTTGTETTGWTRLELEPGPRDLSLAVSRRRTYLSEYPEWVLIVAEGKVDSEEAGK